LKQVASTVSMGLPTVCTATEPPQSQKKKIAAPVSMGLSLMQIASQRLAQGGGSRVEIDP
jgi:hypothetical protein